MELKVDLTKLGKEFDASTWKAQKHIQDSMKRLGIESEVDAKETINTFMGSKGRKQGVDTGLFRDTIHSDVIDSGYGFILKDAVEYGIHHEYGTEEHEEPLVDENGDLTSLGKWAVRHFDVLGYKAIGKSGKKLKKPSRKSREDVVKARGTMMVSLDEMAPFRKALEHAQNISPTVFREEFSE
jgi:hypothetical protein